MKERILVVDDNKSLAKLIAKKMEQNVDMDIVVAHSFGEAKGILDDNDDFFIALLDLNLPDAPNGEIVDYVLSKGILVIVLTGSVDDEIKKTFMEKNIVDYVVKNNINNINYIFDTINKLSKNRDYKVMVVDDSMNTRNELKQILSSQLFRVFAAAHGEEAMNYFNDNPDIKMIITDYKMPVMDGFELMQKIRQDNDKNDVIIIVALEASQTAICANFLKNGANDFIVKPFCKEEIICRINNNLDLIQNVAFSYKFQNVDPLTEVFNRDYFFSFVDSKKGTKFTLSIVSIDDFGLINEKWGYAAGDLALKNVASMLKKCVDNDGFVARFGSDEFSVVLNLDIEQALKKLIEIRSKLAKLVISSDENKFNLTVSIGACDGGIDECIATANRALKKAKNNKNTVEIL